MASGHRWQDLVGLDTIKVIVKKVIPSWTNGLHAVQLDLVSGILDGRDILCCTATGGGKSAAFAIPSLVLLEYNKNPEAYPRGLPTRAKPIGVVITPTKGLANNIIDDLAKLNVSGFSYCSDTLTDARKSGLRLANEIKECIRWQIVCVDPEHLRDKEWREITESPTFRSNVLFACVDEVHLINSWGLSFRPAFTLIGTFLRGRFPSSISVLGLTATLEPGLPTESVCKSLGFFEGSFKLIRMSNERPNTQFIIRFMAHGMTGDRFPDLLPYLASGRKTIIHCQTLRQVLSVHTYLWRCQTDSTDKLIRARMYHAICTPKYNQETIKLIETDPRCQIVIATVAFSNGLNAKMLLDSLSLEFAPTLDEAWQEKGRVGRSDGTIGRGVIFTPRSMIKTAEKYLESLATPSNNLPKTSKAPRILDKSKALVITEKWCYIACVNSRYENPSLDPSRPNLSRLDCLAASRPVPCSLCLLRRGGTINFPASPIPEGFSLLPILTPPKNTTIQTLPVPKKDKLKKAERAVAEKHFVAFGESIRQLEKRSENRNLYIPRSSYFPSNILSLILDQLLVIHFPAQLKDIVKTAWLHYPKYQNLLFDSVISVQTHIIAQRTTKRATANARQRTRQRHPSSVIPEEDSSRSSSPDSAPAPPQIEEPVNPPVTRKRVATEDITNIPKRRRAPRAVQPSVAQALEDYGPKYRTRRRNIGSELPLGLGEKENEPPSRVTRSSVRIHDRN